MESLLIRTLGILALIVALAAFIIFLLVDVARQLLSKNIFLTLRSPMKTERRRVPTRPARRDVRGRTRAHP
jgi:hypothetical protein